MPPPSTAENFSTSASLRTGAEGRPGHVLLITAHFPPDRGAATQRMLRFARALTDAGWALTVVTLDPGSYRRGTPIDEELLARIPPQVKVVRTGAWRPDAGDTSRTVARRLLSAVFQAVAVPDRDLGWLRPALRAALKAHDEDPFDVVVSSAPPFTPHLVARSLARRIDVPWVADFRDPWSRAPWARDRQAATWKGWMHRRLERRTVLGAVRVILNSERMREDFVRHYRELDPSRFVTIANGFDRSVVAPVAHLVPPADGPLLVTHAGTLYGERDPAVLFEALGLLKSDGVAPADIEVTLLGAIADSSQVKHAVRRNGVEDMVRLQPPVTHAEALRRLATSHVLLLFQQGTDLQVPAKLYEYIALGRPIAAVAPKPSAVADIVEATGLGTVTRPEDARALADLLKAHIVARGQGVPLGRADYEQVAAFDGEKLGRRFVELVASLHAG